MLDLLKDLPDGAIVIATILGVISAFAPFLNRMEKVKSITFNQPTLMGLTGGVAALGAYVNAGFILREDLHFKPGLALCFIMAILALSLLGGLATTVKNNKPKIIHLIIGLPLYAFVTAAIFFGVTKFAAEDYFYWRINGVVTQSNKPIEGQEVSLYDAGNKIIKMTRTNTDGKYQFLLTGKEAGGAAIVFAGEGLPPDFTDNSWDEVIWEIKETNMTLINLKVIEVNQEDEKNEN